MNKTFSRIFAVALALVMCVALATTMFAATAETETGSGKITINKNLIMNADAKVPAGATFSFELTAKTGEYTAPDYTGNTTGVTADPGYTVTFVGNEETTPGLPGEDAESKTEGKKYAAKSFTLDFTGVAFTAPGIYHYTLTETAVNAPYTRVTTSRDIDVYVVYVEPAEGEDEGHLAIQSVVASETVTGNDDDQTTTTTSYKSGDFNNEYETYDLTFKKFVKGNQGNLNDDFEFTLTITDCPVAGTYDVNVDSTYTPANPTSITVAKGEGEDAKITGSQTFHLKNGESATVNGLPVGTVYTITEANGNYTATYKVTENGTVLVGENTAGNSYGKTLEGDTEVDFTNTREGTIPTGILLTIAPFAALIVIGAVGVIYVTLKKKSYTK